MCIKKRILSCILVFIMLAILCIYAYGKSGALPAMGKAYAGEETKKIALTFDDGPHPYYTHQLLKGLKERNVKATFFITGENTAAYPEVVKEIHEEGD